MSELAQTVPSFDIPEGILPGEGYNLKKNYDKCSNVYLYYKGAGKYSDYRNKT